MLSRCGLDFLRRHGLVDEPLQPVPQLDITNLRIHTVPLPSPPLPSAPVLQSFEGLPASDRGMTRPWPGPPSQ